jgi:hypothetical protein
LALLQVLLRIELMRLLKLYRTLMLWLLMLRVLVKLDGQLGRHEPVYWPESLGQPLHLLPILFAFRVESVTPKDKGDLPQQNIRKQKTTLKCGVGIKPDIDIVTPNNT